MASPRRTTTQQGLGWEHQKARARALREMQEGEPCPFCAEPMSKDEPLDYDHVIPRSQGGTDGPRRLSHASCNRQAGGRLGARVTNGRKRVVASPQVRPAPGGACYRCGTPMLERQAAVCESAALGAGPVWRHGACPIRYVSVPVDRL
jgi:hypothetical protein